MEASARIDKSKGTRANIYQAGYSNNYLNVSAPSVAPI